MVTKKYITRSMAYAASNRFVNKIGIHHFAHLRALAEGIDPIKSGILYLGVEHGNEARAASLQTIDAVRAIARRRTDIGRTWRLIGISIKLKQTKAQPSLDDFSAERGLDDWSEEEVGIMYEDAYPSDPKATHRSATREKVIRLLFDIETAAAETPRATDLVSGWFDERTATKLIGAGIVNLGDLQNEIAGRKNWYSALPAIGKSKAKRIAQHLDLLLEPSPAFTTSIFMLDDADMQLIIKGRAKIELRKKRPTPETKPTTNTGDAADTKETDQNASTSAQAKNPQETQQASSTQMEAVAEDHFGELILDDPKLTNLKFSLLRAKTDAQAAIEWIEARSESDFTAINYYREATRLLLWLKYERGNIKFNDMKIEDCLAYMSFLQHIPANWMSRKFASPFTQGWAPFRAQLNRDSFRQTVIIIASMFKWLRSADWLQGNPWVLINKKTGTRSKESMIDTKAISRATMTQILDFLDKLPPSPALSRFRFILIFASNVGLRSAELLTTELEKFKLEEDGWMLKVTGKGDKDRIVAVPDIAFKALETYLHERGSVGIEYATSNLPLICKIGKTKEPIVYESLYKSVKSWLSKSIQSADITPLEKSKLKGATTHWLRHTFGTTAVELGVPHDVIKDQMGHKSIEMVARLYGKAPLKRINSEMAKAFG